MGNEIFLGDTLKGGAKKPEVAKVLCYESGPGVDWLVDKFELDLSLIARLGGHSMPRTHRGKERFPGMTITYALMQAFEKVAETSEKARIINKACVNELLTANGGVVGCIYEKAGVSTKEYGPVILCSGGFGADFGSDSLLAKYRPDLLHLPTTNGEHCTGDAIKMGEKLGAETIDLEWVQVHPTGLVKPDDPDAKVKFLAAEALRGVGGLVFDANGKRFANELGRRDYVTGEMWKNKPPFRLALNKAASDEIIWHAKHYTGRGGRGTREPFPVREETREGPRRRFMASVPKWKDLGRAERKNWQRQEILPQHHPWICGQKRDLLRGHHYASNPLLHGRSSNNRGWRVHQGWESSAWFVCRWRGCWWCTRKQSPWRQFPSRLCGLRSRGGPRGIKVRCWC